MGCGLGRGLWPLPSIMKSKNACISTESDQPHTNNFKSDPSRPRRSRTPGTSGCLHVNQSVYFAHKGTCKSPLCSATYVSQQRIYLPYWRYTVFNILPLLHLRLVTGWPWLLAPGLWQIYILCVPEPEVVLSSADFEVNKISSVCFHNFPWFAVLFALSFCQMVYQWYSGNERER